MVLHSDAQTFNRRNKKKNLNVLLLESEYFYTFVSTLTKSTSTHLIWSDSWTFRYSELLNFLEASMGKILPGSRRETSHTLVCSSFSPDDKYHQYEFKHQPSHEECVHMSRSSPSVLFTRYTDLYCEDTLESLFTDLFGSSCKAHLCLCVFWCIHVCVSLMFLFLVQSAVTEQAHVTPAGTGRASGPL